jgi:release factor glutamine methyltransferase
MTDVQSLVVSHPDEIRWLLEEKYGWKREQVHSFLAAPTLLTESFSDQVCADFDELSRGVPVAYLIGWVEFLGTHIDLQFRPLVPRPETEYWVEQFLNQHKSLQEQPLRVLDLCSGSGCIGAAVLKHLPAAVVDAVDISEQAVKQTTHNLKRLDPEQKRWKVIHSDLFSAVTEEYDIILSNPPYIDIYGSYSGELQHEPQEALFAQKSGFMLIEKVLIEVKNHLKAHGELWLEFAADQAERVVSCATKTQLNAEIHTDQFGRDRFAIITPTLTK